MPPRFRLPSSCGASWAAGGGATSLAARAARSDTTQFQITLVYEAGGTSTVDPRPQKEPGPCCLGRRVRRPSPCAPCLQGSRRQGMPISCIFYISLQRVAGMCCNAFAAVPGNLCSRGGCYCVNSRPAGIYSALQRRLSLCPSSVETGTIVHTFLSSCSCMLPGAYCNLSCCLPLLPLDR